MNSIFYQTNDHAGALPPADRGRVATTITLAAVATCMVLGKSLAVTHPPVVQRDEAPTVRIVDPDFCKNQTWPYIDARCLKRVAPDQPVAENRAASAPAIQPPRLLPYLPLRLPISWATEQSTQFLLFLPRPTGQLARSLALRQRQP